MMKYPSYISVSTNKLVSKTMEKTKVIQEVVLPEVSNLNHAVMNKKRRRSEKKD